MSSINPVNNNSAWVSTTATNNEVRSQEIAQSQNTVATNSEEVAQAQTTAVDKNHHLKPSKSHKLHTHHRHIKV